MRIKLADYVFETKQYTDLAMKCLKSYTEHYAGNWDPFMSLVLSIIYSPDSGQIFSDANKYIQEQLKIHPKIYGDTMILSSVL